MDSPVPEPVTKIFGDTPLPVTSWHQPRIDRVDPDQVIKDLQGQ
jgi:hypothetical protein